MTYQEFSRQTAASAAGPAETMANYMAYFRDATAVTADTSPEALIEMVELIEVVAESEMLPTNFLEFIRDTPSVSEQRLLPQVLLYRLRVLQHVRRSHERQEAGIRQPTREEHHPWRAEAAPRNVHHEELRRPRFQPSTERRAQHEPSGGRGYWVRERAPSHNEQSHHSRQRAPARNEQARHSRHESPRPHTNARGWIRRRPHRESRERSEHRHHQQHHRRSSHERAGSQHQRGVNEQSEHLQFRPSQEGGYYVEEHIPRGIGGNNMHHNGNDFYQESVPERGFYQEEPVRRDHADHHVHNHLYQQNAVPQSRPAPDTGFYVTEEREPQNPQHRDIADRFEALPQWEEYEPRAPTPDFYSQYEGGQDPFGNPLTQGPLDTTTYEAPVRRMPTAAEMSEKCTICLELPNTNETVTVLPCMGGTGHWFHHHCIAEWIRMKRVQDCPLRCEQRKAE